jgi:TorA maturation chaperone TorD
MDKQKTLVQKSITVCGSFLKLKNKIMIEVEENKDILIRADFYRLISKGFSYPSEENIFILKGLIDSLLENNLVKAISKSNLEKIKKELQQKEVLKEYSRLFLKGNFPTSESSCCNKLNSIPDVSAFYNAFGLKPVPGEAPDTLVYETEFAALLLVKSYVADTEEQKDICLKAYQKFFNDHLQELCLKIYEKLFSIETTDFYSTLSTFMIQHIQQEESTQQKKHK